METVKHMSDKSQIGLIGLAVMGQNLARNLARAHKVTVYNRTTETMQDFIGEHGSENLAGEAELEGFVNSLEKPRKIILMVKAGRAVDAVIGSLLPFLDKGDIIIDGGNSHFPDTIRREKELSEKDMNFFGCGVSGGEEGALNGPSIMPGGSTKVWKELEPILKKIAAKDFEGEPCVTYIGENGAGHYVKMVHNGIEYAVMQMMAEAYDFYRSNGLSASEIGNIFEKYNQGKLKSFLFEISVPILRKKDEKGTDEYLLDLILDKAGQKGTGRWTGIEGLERGIDISCIQQAVNARIVSSRKNYRVELDKKYKKPYADKTLPKDVVKELVPVIENGLYAAMLIAYAQGFDLLRQAAEEMEWDLNYAEIARIWQGGCIIRAQILKTLTEAFKEANNAPLWEIEQIVSDLQDNWLDLRATVSLGVQAGTPLFCLGAALASFEAMSDARGSANFIQGLRDSFGAHTYKRIDQDGIFHTEWS